MTAADTVILANGDFPKRGSEPWRLLATAKRVVACDGAATAFRRRFGRWPEYIVGDMDSFRRGTECHAPVPHLVSDQDTNDLTKAIDFCRTHRWRKAVIVGATGKREDHSLGNVFRGLEAGLPIVTEHGVFHPVAGKASFRGAAGTAVSVFVPDPAVRVKSSGLEWPLGGVVFDTLYRGTLNRMTAGRFTVESTGRIYVYIAN